MPSRPPARAQDQPVPPHLPRHLPPALVPLAVPARRSTASAAARDMPGPPVAPQEPARRLTRGTHSASRSLGFICGEPRRRVTLRLRDGIVGVWRYCFDSRYNC